jgi:Replication initiator protein, pSAM2
MTVLDAPPPVTPELLAGLAHRAARPDFPRFEAQLRSSGYCARPVRLQGRIETCNADGRRRVWSTETEPDGILRKACGNRREAVCPPCAERYRGDAYQLIAAGLRGGKGVPETVIEHPAVFVTLTAPSFGAVHTRQLGPDGRPRRCRPRRDAPVCEHGVRVSCGAAHDEDDPRLGEPLCLECFDHAGAVVWNNALSELWRRTVPVYLPRTLAGEVEMTQARLRELVRVAYVKVAEYQRRGLVHLHAVIRLDKAMPTYRADELRPPDPRFSVDLLEHAIRQTVQTVSAPLPDELGGGRIQWGSELDVRPLDPDQRREVAGYLAKYATKSTEQAGGVLHAVTDHDLDALPVREHVRSYMREAFALHSDPALADRRFGPCAHAFGCRAHCLTKSRRYSTTFKALRQAREQHVHEQLLARAQDAAQRALAEAVERVASFRYAGQGHLTAADEMLARSAAARAREHRRLAREERAMEVNTGGAR